jgi:hypothetical protein
VPFSAKGWSNYPSPSTQLDAAALIGLETRAANYVGAVETGPGVAAQPDFVVTQAGGGSMLVNVGAAGVLQRASISLDANGGTQRYEYSGAQLTGTITTANASLPRIDIVTLAPSANVDSNVPQVLVIAGTPTAGASLSNRTGAPALPAGRILLADVLVPAAATSILTAQIRDRRPYFLTSVSTGIFSAIDQVSPEPNPAIPTGLQTLTAGANDNRVGAIQCWLPRRILAARIRWSYRQGATAAATNYQFYLADASGRYIANTAATAFSGAATSQSQRNEALASAVQLEAGALWLIFILSSMTASSTVTFNGANIGSSSASQPNVSGPNVGAVISGTGIGSTDLISAGFLDAVAGSAQASVPLVQIGA